MSMDRIAFQPGLSMRDFQSRYGTEAQCESAVSPRVGPRAGAAHIAGAPARFKPVTAQVANCGSA